MRGTLLKFESGIQIESCHSCGVEFGMAFDFYRRRREDGKLFYCPSGHGQHYTETEISRLEKELAAAKQAKEWAEQSRDSAKRMRDVAEKQLRASKGQLTKIKKRVGHGVCPCCKRTFIQLARHMEAQHPTFTVESK